MQSLDTTYNDNRKFFNPNLSQSQYSALPFKFKQQNHSTYGPFGLRRRKGE